MPTERHRARLVRTHQAMGPARCLLFALPDLCPELERVATPAIVEAWTPPYHSWGESEPPRLWDRRRVRRQVAPVSPGEG